MQFLKSTAAKKAVAYYRHSAEDKQENSVPIQREHAQKFAEKFGFEIIHEEADEGVSGLTANRPGFKRLLNDWVINPNAPLYQYILVYDVSRWGRFQNQNEAAYYEHICEQNNKKVIYVSRGSLPKEEQELTYSIITPMERWMAAQYSKQLSDKVWYGCIKVSKDGYSAGGIACYGMARLLLDVNKKPIRILKKGEHKQIANERVTFAPLNDETTKTVKEIFNLFLDDWASQEEIAEKLNEKGIKVPNGGEWSRSKIIHILTNETYTGTRLYNKTRGRLKQKKVDNPRNEWVVTPEAFEAVIKPERFWMAQERLFWMIPSKWKKGLYTITKVQKSVEGEIKTLLLNQGATEDEADKKVRMTPITYSISFYEDSIPYRCFVIPEQVRNFDYVFGVGISLYRREPIDNIFYIPTADFSKNNFIMFSEKDACFPEYVIESNQIEEKILALIKE